MSSTRGTLASWLALFPCTSRVGGLIPGSALCAWSLDVLPVFRGFPPQSKEADWMISNPENGWLDVQWQLVVILDRRSKIKYLSIDQQLN